MSQSDRKISPTIEIPSIDSPEPVFKAGTGMLVYSMQHLCLILATHLLFPKSVPRAAARTSEALFILLLLIYHGMHYRIVSHIKRFPKRLDSFGMVQVIDLYDTIIALCVVVGWGCVLLYPLYLCTLGNIYWPGVLLLYWLGVLKVASRVDQFHFVMVGTDWGTIHPAVTFANRDWREIRRRLKAMLLRLMAWYVGGLMAWTVGGAVWGAITGGGESSIPTPIQTIAEATTGKIYFAAPSGTDIFEIIKLDATTHRHQSTATDLVTYLGMVTIPAGEQTRATQTVTLAGHTMWDGRLAVMVTQKPFAIIHGVGGLEDGRVVVEG